MLQTIVVRSLDSIEKTREGAWSRVKREFWPALSHSSFGILATVACAIMGVLVGVGRGGSTSSSVLLATAGAFAGLLVAASAVLAALAIKAPYWQRDEARAERDLLNKQVEGAISEAALKRDTELLHQLVELLPSEKGAIEYLRIHDFAARFFYRHIDPLYTLMHNWDNAEHEFITPQVEERRRELLREVDHFLGLIGAHTFPVEHERHLPREEARGELPREWEKEAPEKYYTVHRDLNDTADRIVNAHQNLIREARQRLPD